MTVLVIGGSFQGKRMWAKQSFCLQDSDFICGDICIEDELKQARALDGLHRYVYRLLKDGKTTKDLTQILTEKVILCDEIGCGVVPFDREKDDWREAVGRLCCDIAAQADLVVRVQAGIGHVIKGQRKGGDI